MVLAPTPDRPSGHGHPEAGEQGFTPAKAQPEAVVQEGAESLGLRAYLGARRPEGIGALLNVASLHPGLVITASDPDLEHGGDGAHVGKLYLPLQLVTFVGDGAPTVRTTTPAVRRRARDRGARRVPCDARDDHGRLRACVPHEPGRTSGHPWRTALPGVLSLDGCPPRPSPARRSAGAGPPAPGPFGGSSLDPMDSPRAPVAHFS